MRDIPTRYFNFKFQFQIRIIKFAQISRFFNINSHKETSLVQNGYHWEVIVGLMLHEISKTKVKV